MKSLPGPDNKLPKSRKFQESYPRPRKKPRGKPRTQFYPQEELKVFAEVFSQLTKQSLAVIHNPDYPDRPTYSPLSWEQVYQVAENLTDTPNKTFFQKLVKGIGLNPPEVSIRQKYWAHRLAIDTLYRYRTTLKGLPVTIKFNRNPTPQEIAQRAGFLTQRIESLYSEEAPDVE